MQIIILIRNFKCKTYIIFIKAFNTHNIFSKSTCKYLYLIVNNFPEVSFHIVISCKISIAIWMTTLNFIEMMLLLGCGVKFTEA